jgi:hypothetical protein
MKAVIVHGLLALFGLALAYQTYNRKPEADAAPGSVVAVDCSADALQKITLRTPTFEAIAEPKREHGATTFWLSTRTRSLDEDKPKAADKPVEPAKPAVANADATKADATKPDATKADATKPDATKPDATKADATKPAPAKEVPELAKPRHYLANPTFAEYLKRFAPMRALRSLGTLPKDKDADFGFDKVGTYVKLQCAGRTTDFEVGARAFGASQRYFRDTKTKTTYLFEEQLVSDLESANFKFMQSDLHAFAGDEVEELTISAQGAKKRLLHRDRKIPDQALWVDASAPAKRNELYNNWFSRLARLRARLYLPDGADPGSDLKGQSGGTEPVLTIDYKVADKPGGKLELVRVDENGVGHYYARSETTRNWVTLFDSAAKEVEQDVGMVVGTEQAPSKPAGASPAAAQSGTAPVVGHGSSLPPGHPAMPTTEKPH